jgi:DNA-binding NarL/FixJ family response regulator
MAVFMTILMLKRIGVMLESKRYSYRAIRDKLRSDYNYERIPSVATIGRYARKLGHKRTTDRTHYSQQEVKDLFNNGLSVTKIAKKLQLTRGQVTGAIYNRPPKVRRKFTANELECASQQDMCEEQNT